MESILATISVVAFLAAITAWSFAWKINNAWAEYTKKLIEETEKMNADWADFYRMICEKEKQKSERFAAIRGTDKIEDYE